MTDAPRAADSLVVFVTAPLEAASGLAHALVERRLVACVNLVPQIRSVYRWEGQIADESEVLLIMKTRADRFPALEEAVRALHPYAVPEVIGVALASGSVPYLNWIADQVRPIE